MYLAYCSEYLGQNKPILDQKKKGAELVVHATIRMAISPEKATEALEILCSMAERTKVKSGCISSRIYRDVQAEHAHAIMIEELWRSQEELLQHLRSSDYHRVLLVVEMSNGPPEIRFSAISHSSGVETIEKAREPLLNRGGRQ